MVSVVTVSMLLLTALFRVLMDVLAILVGLSSHTQFHRMDLSFSL